MKILNLTKNSNVYTSNVYFVLGSSNAIDDINTLVDVGRDPSIIAKIENTSTGVGKHKVEQVVLTHSHFDHAELLPQIRKRYHPEVCAYSMSLKGVDRLLRDGETLKIGDRAFEVIYTPGHSNDSICLYCQSEGVLFAGDSNIIIHSPCGSYEKGFIDALIRLSRRNIKKIYFGHGSPLFNGCNTKIRCSLNIVKKA
ncbi:MAG: MBL fold metallo-hydrolase [Bacteroidales bacterium]|nr:MBL fold metallo-hydrolase [Bacteroidales bacterium]